MFSLFNQSVLTQFFAVFLWFLSHFYPFGIQAWACNNFRLSNVLCDRDQLALASTACQKCHYFPLTVISKCRQWHLRGTYLKFFSGVAITPGLPSGLHLWWLWAQLYMYHFTNLTFFNWQARLGISVCKARRAVSNNIQLKLKYVCSFICYFNKFMCSPPPRPKFINTVQCFVRIVSKNGIHVVLHILNLIYYQASKH